MSSIETKMAEEEKDARDDVTLELGKDTGPQMYRTTSTAAPGPALVAKPATAPQPEPSPPAPQPPTPVTAINDNIAASMLN